MSRNQKAPLLAFVLVALVCGVILVDSMRGEAFERQRSVLAPTQVEQPVLPQGREPQASIEPPGALAEGPDPVASDVAQGAEEQWSPLGSLVASTGRVPDEASIVEPGQAPVDGTETSTDESPKAHRAPDGSSDAGRGHKNPQPVPKVEQPPVVEDPTAPVDPVDPKGPAEPDGLPDLSDVAPGIDRIKGAP